MRLCLVSDEREDRDLIGGGHLAWWGDRGQDDPWTGPLVFLSSEASDRLPVHDGAQEVTVRGRPGYVAPAPLFQAVSSADYGHVATWFERPGLVAELTIRRGSADDAVRMAEVVTFDGEIPALPPDHLGTATGTLSTGPFPSPLALDPLSAWRLSWFDAAGGRSLTVRGLVDVPDVLQLLSAFTAASELTTVEGHPALAYAAFDPEGGPNGVAWEEADGLVVQVSGLGLGAEEIEKVAESVADVGTDGWAELAANTEECFPSSFPR